MDRAVQVGDRWVIHNCEASQRECECDPMPRFEDAAALATHLGLELERVSWTGIPSRGDVLKELQTYKALVAATSNRALLRDLREGAPTPAQSRRAWEALRLAEESTPKYPLPFTTRWEDENYVRRHVPGLSVDAVGTRVQLVKVKSEVQCLRATSGTRICISDGADLENRDAPETWTMVQQLTVGLVYEKMQTEVVVAVEEDVIATFTYDEGSQVLLQCVGQVGMGLELLGILGRVVYELISNSAAHHWVREFEDVADLLVASTGVAAMSEFKAGDARGMIKPSGCSEWMRDDMFEAILPLLTTREGFVDLREWGMQSTAMPVSAEHTPLMCPHCWVTGEPNSHSPTVQVRPLRLVGSHDKQDEYTAVSHLWTEFRGDKTIRSMKNDAVVVGGPATLWIDKLCINQDDSDEKAIELSHMGSYYAGASTTLICPARPVASIPLVKQSRHLVAIPSHLNDFQGLRSWREDPWHNRVWTFQEAYLSRNPRVVNSDTNSGFDASWLDFMAFAATQTEPVRCQVGLPPWRQDSYPSHYGRLGEYVTPFLQSWVACNRHNWVPDISNIRIPLAKLLQLTHSRQCTEERDRIIGVLGLALSAEQFVLQRVSSLDDAYREAVRCGALGAEVLLADLGGTSPNSSWIPKSGREARYPPFVRNKCDAFRPVVDDDGTLVCKASEVEMDMDEREKCSEWGDHHRLNVRMHGGTTDATVGFQGLSSTRGKAYILEGTNNWSLNSRILLWASEAGSGTHHVEASGIINWGPLYRNAAKESDTEKGDGIVTLRLG
ncbi:hypothetical protein F5Y14DRAFT_436195 [Nemania sp. NC0429]|nr:hypothetical protein F5Y14DRAFT_436195 [Nemania sp. NC0429]